MHQPSIKSVRSRHSVRKYQFRELPGEKLAEIFEILTVGNEGPFGNTCRFWLIDTESFREDPVRLGTYGFISGLRYIVAGAVEKDAVMSLEDYGYVLERKILEFTRMGLGTCWIGGTFRRSEYAKTTSLETGEVIPAITPVGYPAEKKGIREHIIKFLARSSSRKDWSELFFDNGPATPLTAESAGIFAEALEMVRQAPSANNAQPWRIIKEGNRWHFFLARNKMIDKSYTSVDLQRIDLGIAMAHFDLARKEKGISGDFNILDKITIPTEWSYVASFHAFLPE